MAIKTTLKLSEARKQARKIQGDVAKEHDPLAERRKKERQAENTLQSVCESYFAREGKKLRTIRERQTTLARLVYPKLGARQIDEVRRSDIVRLLDRIEDNNGPVMADHTLAYLRRVFTWHAGRSDDFRSPIVRGMARTKPAELARDRILSDDEIRKIWTAADQMNGCFGAFIKFLTLTAARRDEAARVRRSEIDGADWTVPASRNKGKRDNTTPLSKSAQAIINALPRIGNGDLVFSHDGVRFLGGFSKFKAKLDQLSGVSGWRLHDLRRTARSLMSRAGVDSDIAERCLGHVIGGVRGVYDHHSFLEEKRRAFEALAAQIERIINPKENVIALRGKQ